MYQYPYVGHDQQMIAQPPQQPWIADQNFPQIRVEELTEKCKELVAEYNRLLRENQEIKDNLENQEKKKKILSSHDYFLMEMEKVKLSIQTYKDALYQLEEFAQITKEAIAAPIPD